MVRPDDHMPLRQAPRLHRRTLLGAQMQAQLAAPPQDIVGVHRPFVVVQVVQFGLVQAGGNFGAETVVGGALLGTIQQQRDA